jgi:hypothetical protein
MRGSRHKVQKLKPLAVYSFVVMMAFQHDTKLMESGTARKQKHTQFVFANKDIISYL